MTEAMHAWNDFYVVFATAAATLLGAMFVVASIGTGFLTRERASEARIFLTPTVGHLAFLLVAALLALLPAPDGRALAWGYGAIALCGLAYAGRVGWRVVPRKIELGDRLWYGLAPVLGYAALLATALMQAWHMAFALEARAAALVFLLLAAIRNAWDILIFFVVQPRGGP